MPGLLQISLQISYGLFSVHSPALNYLYRGCFREKKDQKCNHLTNW